MFKKMVILSAAVALIMLGIFVDPSAAQVTSVSKKGSLLIFPKIKTFTSPTLVRDTVITIGNDSAASTWVKCYWMDANQVPYDFEFMLTGYQPIWFSAKDGLGTAGKEIAPFGDNSTGELKCWAINIDPPAQFQTEILRVFNDLYGTATFIQSGDGVPTAAFEYNAWAFKLNSVPLKQDGPLNLDGFEYDTCPSYLVYNFFPYNATVDFNFEDLNYLAVAGNSVLSLSPCQQDLRQDRTPICTKAQFNIWNENEVKFTGAYQCVKCYFEGVLAQIGTKNWEKMDGSQACDLPAPYPGNTKCKKSGVGGSKFTFGTLHTDLARFRVSPSNSTACNGVFSRFANDGKTVVDVCLGNQYQSPFVGVLLTDLSTALDIPPTFFDMFAGTTGTQAGQFSGPTRPNGIPPQILWDAGQTSQAGAAKK